MSTWLIVLIVIITVIILFLIVSPKFREGFGDLLGEIIEGIVDLFD